jgi:hypothetical protein
VTPTSVSHVCRDFFLGRTCRVGWDEILPEQKAKLKEAAKANYRAADAAAAKGGEGHYWMALFALAEIADTPEQKMELLKLAHEGGVILAARLISRHHHLDEAKRWLKLGADQGDPWANAELGRMYWKGNEDYAVKKDWERALFYFTLAVKIFENNGYAASAEIKKPMFYRANLARRLPVEKVAEIWERAQAWKPSPVSGEPRAENQPEQVGAAAQ